MQGDAKQVLGAGQRGNRAGPRYLRAGPGVEGVDAEIAFGVFARLGVDAAEDVEGVAEQDLAAAEVGPTAEVGDDVAAAVEAAVARPARQVAADQPFETPPVVATPTARIEPSGSTSTLR